MLEHLAGAIVIAGWTSVVWAPLIIGVTVRMPRYRWPAAAGVAATMLAVFGVFAYGSFRPSPECETLETESAKAFCWDGEAIRAAVLGYMSIVMAAAVLLASAIFLFGPACSRETRKVAE